MNTFLLRRTAGAALLTLCCAAPASAQLGWTAGLSTDLPRLDGAAAAYDSGRGRVVLFGGRDELGVAQDWTWQWDGTTWTTSAPATRPIARSGARAVYVPTRQRIVLFGGQGDASGLVYGDTWEFDGADWSRRNFFTAPGPRTGHAFVWDAARQRGVLHGGFDPTGRVLGDTWEFDGVNWIPRNTGTTGPQERALHAMAFDAARGRVVLFGGQTSSLATSAVADVWEWDGGTWTERAISPATARVGSELAFDPRTSTLHLYGGSIRGAVTDSHLELLAGGWSTRSGAPGRRTGHALLYVPGEGVCTIAGSGDGGYRNDVVRYTNGRWTHWPATTGSVSGGALARLGQSNAMVHFGGFADGRVFGSTWMLDSGAEEWRFVPLAVSPVARSKPGMAGHPTRNEILLFGGTDGAPRNDTWIFDGTTWTEQTQAARPGRRQGHKIVFHPEADNYVTFAGRGSTGLWTNTLTYAQGTWTSLLPANSPPARTDYGLAYDGTNGTVLLFGGRNDSGAALDDTWSWDGSAWHPLNPTRRPAPRSGHVMEWDTERQRIVLFGGAGNSGDLGDTWEWTGSNWTQRAPSASPSPRQFAAGAYDAARRAVMIHGGQAFAPAVFYDSTHWLQPARRGTFTQLGVSCGRGTVAIAGSPCLGSERFALRFQTGILGAATFLLIDVNQQQVRLDNCAIYVPAGISAGVASSGLTGEARFPLSIPLDPALSGATFDAQAFTVQSGGPLFDGLSPSPGVRVVIGD